MAGSGGSVRQRSNGLWEGRYRQDGRFRSVYAKTSAEAKAKLRTAMTNLDAGIRSTPSRLTVGAWLDEWLDTTVRRTCRPRTIASYEATCTLYIRPSVGTVPLARLTPEHVARMLTKLEARGTLSSTTVLYALRVLRIALGRAVKSGRITRNVATLVDAPSKSTPALTPLTADQARTLLASVAGDRFGPLYTLAIATGMRQGELLGLRWDAVDLDGGSLAVRATLNRVTRDLAEPKTERSRRTLVLSTAATEALREQRRRQLAERLAAGRRWMDAGLVFTTGVGTAVDAGRTTRALHVALERAGLPRQRFHDLRHAYASLMLSAGEELAVVSKSLGHSTFGTTVDVYSHLTRTMQERSAERMDRILAG